MLAIGAVGGEVVTVEDAQRLERGHALGRGRQLVDLDVAEGHVQRFDPRARVRGDVGRGHEPAVPLQGLGDRGADRAAVVGVGSVVAQGRDRARQAGLAEPCPFDRAAVARLEIVERAGESRLAPEVLVHRPRATEHPRTAARERESLERVAQRRAAEVGERSRAEPFEQLEPTAHRAGHGHRVRADDRHGVGPTRGTHRLGGRTRGSAARRPVPERCGVGAPTVVQTIANRSPP